MSQVNAHLTINDFNIKAIEKQYITQELLENSNINMKTLPVMEYVHILMQRGLIGIRETDNVIYELFRGKLPVIKQVGDNEYKIIEPSDRQIDFHPSLELSKSVTEIYDESIEKFGFDNPELRIIIHSLDHIHKKIKVLIPLFSQEIVEALKKIKTSFQSVTEERRHIIVEEDGRERIENRKIDDYKIVFYITPITFIDAFQNNNRKVEKQLQNKTTELKRQKQALGFSDALTAYDTQTLQETGNQIESILSVVFKAQQKVEASDIHIEPDLHSGSRDSGGIRIRVDGKLKKSFPVEGGFNSIVRDLKVLSGLNPDKTSIPQDGKLSIRVAGIDEELAYRVSTIPIGEQKQEKVVLRGLKTGSEHLDIEKMGMDKKYRDIINTMVGNPHKDKIGKYRDGMILVTGPTGSGKTTTVGSIISQLNVPEVNIQTLEDPIEYTIKGVNQSQISDYDMYGGGGDSYTFARGLRAILRQDPDIIWLGEIRDEETMEAAKDAAATGHLLFSSVHTNNTWDTFDRLLSLGFNPNMIGNMMRLIIAQRLGRMVCPHCMLEYSDPQLAESAKEQAEREETYLNMRLEIYRKLIDSPFVDILPKKVLDLKIYQGKGCISCDHTGEKGRMGIYEFMPINISIQNFILEKGVNAPKDEVRKLFIKEGIATLYQDAMYKVIHGRENPATGLINYMSYNSALAAVGYDLYDFGEEYKNDDIEHLEARLAAKQTQRKIEKIKQKIQEIEFQVLSKEKKIQFATSEEEKETLRQEIETLKTSGEKYKKVLEGR